MNRKLSRKAGESRLGTPDGRCAIRRRAGNGHHTGNMTFDRSRNAEKRDPKEYRGALLERLARRRRESWKREKYPMTLRGQKVEA